jgi:hypothetical protein
MDELMCNMRMCGSGVLSDRLDCLTQALRLRDSGRNKRRRNYPALIYHPEGQHRLQARTHPGADPNLSLGAGRWP